MAQGRKEEYWAKRKQALAKLSSFTYLISDILIWVVNGSPKGADFVRELRELTSNCTTRSGSAFWPTLFIVFNKYSANEDTLQDSIDFIANPDEVISSLLFSSADSAHLKASFSGVHCFVLPITKSKPLNGFEPIKVFKKEMERFRVGTLVTQQSLPTSIVLGHTTRDLQKNFGR